ncbi:BrnA antitoxin family protein [Burkholderia alba]|uniref:BrnA antitoxin family protein n=1 Tax=Burkholderia alba TaxID=2683677 RepID=UPI002B058FCA|nr:BrnA antitoxin family protein [Burkholderia alba]
MRSKPRFVVPTAREEAAINRGIAADPDTRELTDEDFAQLRPFAAVIAKKIGRPKLERPKEQVSIRYDADVLDAFRAGGAGWQTRMNDALRDWLNTHRP